jgi:hypothetical protein
MKWRCECLIPDGLQCPDLERLSDAVLVSLQLCHLLAVFVIEALEALSAKEVAAFSFRS